jgi:O-antigen/teichoic acid export membrane protein
MSDLREAVLRAAIFMTLREAAGLLVGLVGSFAIAFEIGPSAYGIYAAASIVYIYLCRIYQCGIGTFLIRSDQVEKRTADIAFTLLVGIGGLGLICAIPIVALVGWWNDLADFMPVALALCVGLPLELLRAVPLSLLERDLRYGRVASIEFIGQVLFYAVALPLAFIAPGPWVLVAGWWCLQLVLSVGFFASSSYRPRLAWEFGTVRSTLSYGLGYTGSIWLWSLRSLVNPLVVGRYVGADAVGVLALTIRLVESLSFVKGITSRISLAALAKVNRDGQQLATAIKEGAQLQVFTVGTLLCTFALLSPYFDRIVAKPAWQPLFSIFPYIALGLLVNSAFAMHVSALYVLRRNRDVAIFHSLHVILFAAGALVFVPGRGLIGYGIAEFVAMPSYLVIHYFLSRQTHISNYGSIVIWVIGFGLILFAPASWMAAAIGLCLVIGTPATWRFVATNRSLVLRMLARTDDTRQ